MITPLHDRTALLQQAIERFLPEWEANVEVKKRLALKYQDTQIEAMLLLCMALIRLHDEGMKWSPRNGEKLEDCMANFDAACAAVIESERACFDVLTPNQRKHVANAVAIARQIGGPCPLESGREEGLDDDVLSSNILNAAGCILFELRRGLPAREGA